MVGIGGMQTDMENELRILHLDPQTEATLTGQCSLSIGDLKDHPQSDTFPPTRPYPLIVPLPVRPFSLQPPQEGLSIASLMSGEGKVVMTGVV